MNNDPKFYAYILLCADGTCYSGYTTNISAREKAHNSGKGAKYTRSRRPVKVIYYEEFDNKSEALKREAALKKLSHKQKMRLAENFEIRKQNNSNTNEEAGLMLFIYYPKCTTCQKAKKWLDENRVLYAERNIVDENPGYDELLTWYRKSGLTLKRFFNTSGLKYRELGLKNKLSEMTEEEQLKLLASDGMLVKRPLLVSEGIAVPGFKEEEWKKMCGIE